MPTPQAQLPSITDWACVLDRSHECCVQNVEGRWRIRNGNEKLRSQRCFSICLLLRFLQPATLLHSVNYFSPVMKWPPIVRSSLFCLGLFWGALSTPLCAADSPNKPNIIFILADDYGLPGVGCYGGDFKTPHIDALAARGLRFDYCFAAPLCAPSRPMLMTGRYPFRTGVLDNSTGPVSTPQT